MAKRSEFAGITNWVLTDREQKVLNAYGSKLLGEAFHRPDATYGYEVAVFGAKTMAGLVSARLLEEGPDQKHPNINGYRLTAEGRRYVKR